MRHLACRSPPAIHGRDTACVTVVVMTITVSTDGSALGNPNGPMGWAWADHELNMAHSGGHEHGGDCDAGGATNGTNQIGELCAVLEALRAHPGAEPLVIETDSQYAINCSTKWVHGWKKNGWKNSQKKPVKNAALIRAIDAELSRRAGSVKFVWVKGHAGNAGNEKVDDLARTYAGDCRSGVQEGYLPKEGWQSLLASEYAKGTDVPEDAQMLLDGKISTQEYHLGRGGESGEAGAEHESDGDNVAKRIRKPSLAELLAEPEGVPGYGEIQSDTSSTTAMSTPTVPITTESDATVALSSNSAQAEDTQSGSSTRSVAEPAAPRLSPTALTASGTLRFTPPPSTSPTYDGRPRIIHGLVRVDGYVNGDGTITLDNAAFYTDKQG